MIYHSGIFYPEREEALRKLTEPIGQSEAHKAFILPHMRLDFIAGLYRTAFASISDGRRIVALLPLHRELLSADRGKKILTSPSRIEKTPLGDVRITSLGSGDGETYEEEEYSLELLYPFVASHNPSSELCPVFTRLESSQDAKELESFLRTLDDGNTVFIVSSNMTGKLPEEQIAAERGKVVEMLGKGEGLMDEWRKGHISPCGAPIITAVSRLGSGRWQLIGISEKETKAGHAALFMD